MMKILAMTISTWLTLTSQVYAANLQVFNDSFSQDYTTKKYFSRSYEESRNRFRNFLIKTTTKPKDEQLLIPSRIDPDLTVDYKYIPAKNKKGLIILSSGTHGGEAYAGSAIQLLFMEKYLTNELLENNGVLIIHGLNPYGFKYFRRVTEQNVDLNRNFSGSDVLFQFQNNLYEQLTDLLQPKTKASAGFMFRAKIFVRLIYQLITLGRKDLFQGILQGQYHQEKGLCYGGQDFEPQTHKIKQVIKSYGALYERVLHIDLHTGFGERGKLHFFGTNKASRKNADFQKQVFSDIHVDTGDDENFYEVKGDFSNDTKNLFDDKPVATMVFEYGTLDSQTTMGGFSSLLRTIQENQGHFYGFVSSKDREEIKNNYQEVFFPKDSNWRNAVINQANRFLPVILSNFEKAQ